jgi:hypothetical protein
MDTNFLNLSSTCFTVQNYKIVEGTFRDFERFIEITPTPHGIQRKFFIKQAIVEKFDDEIAGCHLDFVSSPKVNDDVVYALLYWQSDAENILLTFENERNAQNKLEEFAVLDILNNNEIVIHLNRNSAENELHNLLEDQAL